MVREVEYARLVDDYKESIHALQQLCDGGTDEAVAILHVEESCKGLHLEEGPTHAHVGGRARALRSYAGMGWEEFCALEKKWEELQEMLSKYHPDESLPMSRSRNGSRTSMGSGADAEQQIRERSSSDQARPLRTPTLSMDAISDDHDEDEDGGSDDEW